MQTRVTRVELLELVEPAFAVGPGTKIQIFAVAADYGVRPEAIAAVERLDGEGRFKGLRRASDLKGTRRLAGTDHHPRLGQSSVALAEGR